MSKQKLSLQEQLLKSGLVSSAKAKAVKTDKRKQEQQQRKNNVVVADDTKEQLQKAKAEQLEKDRELNLAKRQLEEQKQVMAQVKQLIEQNKLAQDEDGVAYHFNDHNKVKTLYVSKAMRDQLVRGSLAIVTVEPRYEVVSAEVALKIRQRDAGSVVVFNEPVADAGKQDIQDDYAAYQIPDDLMW